jgi:hypothetical protein
MLQKYKPIEVQYYQTYYFANVVDNVLENPQPFLANLEGFWGDDNYLAFIQPYQEFSAFHQFIEYIIRDLLFDQQINIDLEERRKTLEDKGFICFPAYEMDLKRLPIDHALAAHSITTEGFDLWLKEREKTFFDVTQDDIYEYYQELQLTEEFDTLITQMVREVFFLMFLNRGALLRFNDIVSRIIGMKPLTEVPDEAKHLFSKKGVLKRVNPPGWARRATFFRDRGRCVLCNCDLSGLLSLQNKNHFDHVVPLATAGLNDVSNLQLLCESCNTSKAAKKAITSLQYENWY